MGSTLGALAAYYAYYMGWKKSYAKRQSDKKIHQMAAWQNSVITYWGVPLFFPTIYDINIF